MATTTDGPQPLPVEITSAVAGVWKRYSTKRPTNGTTVISGRVVRCVLPDSVGDFAEGLEAVEDEDDRAGKIVSYRREAAAAVAKVTDRRVLAFISEHDVDTDVATETFMLDSALSQPAFGDAGWIAH